LLAIHFIETNLMSKSKNLPQAPFITSKSAVTPMNLPRQRRQRYRHPLNFIVIPSVIE
jgi:hypothetical protein